MTVGKKVALTCISLVALSVITTAVALQNGSKMLASIQGTSLTIPALQRLAALQALGLEYRGTSLLMGTPGLADQYKRKQVAHLDDLRKEVLKTVAQSNDSITQEERSLFETTRTQTQRFLDTCDQFRSLALSGQGEQAGAFWSAHGGEQSKAFRKAIQDEVDFNNHSANKIIDIGLSAAAVSKIWCCALAVLSVLLGSLLSWLLVRNLNQTLGRAAKEIRSIAVQVADASSQVSSSSRQLAQNSSEQAASLQETSASGHQISAMTARNSEHSRVALTLMRTVDGCVKEANQKLDLMITSMSDITSSSNEIAKIIKIIEDIAFQTNILALNAAVEAARAGEAGMGFAVVADEVRNLAGRCSAAAQDTATLIERSVVSARTGGTRLNEVATVTQAITSNAAEVSRLVDEVNVGAAEQSRGMAQIANALVKMEQVTQRTAATSQESAAASMQLESQSKSMREVVLHLETLIVGQG